MSYDVIRTGMEARLIAISDSWPTAWANSGFDPKVSAIDSDGRPVPYQEAFMLRNTTVAAAAGTAAPNRESGIFQVTVCIPLGWGQSIADDRADAIRAQFPRGFASLLTPPDQFWIEQTPSVASGLRDEDWWRVPVSIGWVAYVYPP